MNAYMLEGKRLRCEIDPDTGTLQSIRILGDPFQTEFCANVGNLLYPEMRGNDQWLGDWQMRVWDGKAWRLERTASAGTRQVDKTDRGVSVRWSGSGKEDGLQALEVSQLYRLDGDDLSLTMEMTNISGGKIDVGEVSLALLTNTDFNSVFEQIHKDTPYHWYGPAQRDWHEQRVFQHLHLAGSNSYAFLQRPRGDFPALLIHPENGTYVETAYQIVPGLGSHWSLNFEGPYYLSLFSKAPRQVFGWLKSGESQRYWFNGNNSIVLEPGEKFSCAFRFAVVDAYEGVGDKLAADGLMDVHAVPGMVAPVDQPILFALRVKDGEPDLKLDCGGAHIDSLGVSEGIYRYRLTSTVPGQKKVRVKFAGGETNLLFFTLPDIAATLKNHARFIAERQFCDNPDDAFDRFGLFLPYDDVFECLFLESEESWQVGGTDEYCFPLSMFLAEKNSLFPEQKQIDILERFIEEGLWRSGVQDRDTFEVIRGLYWEDRTPADESQNNKWSYERSRSKLRTFNYPLLMDMYFSMYRVAKRFGMTRRHTAEEYLEFAFRCAMKWFDLGRNKNNGAPAGATITEVLDALKLDAPEHYATLYPLVERCASMNASVEYPYGSELYVDQTPHNQVYALLDYFRFNEKKMEALRVTEALRAGMQPTWYKLGNEKRGNVCVWYATPLNTRVLYEGYDLTGDARLLEWGCAGLLSFLTTQRENGASHGWFTWWPDRAMFDQRSLDTDMGMYGYLKSARAYVVEDKLFGAVGYGCAVEQKDGMVTARVNDGVGRRLRFVDKGVEIRSENEEIVSATVSEDSVWVETRPVCKGAACRIIVHSGGRKVILNGTQAREGENNL